MSPPTLLLTALAMLAFAGNSLLCRLALRETAIDAASFTAVRLLAGACTLWLLLQLHPLPLPLPQPPLPQPQHQVPSRQM